MRTIGACFGDLGLGFGALPRLRAGWRSVERAISARRSKPAAGRVGGPEKGPISSFLAAGKKRGPLAREEGPQRMVDRSRPAVELAKRGAVVASRAAYARPVAERPAPPRPARAGAAPLRPARAGAAPSPLPPARGGLVAGRRPARGGLLAGLFGDLGGNGVGLGVPDEFGVEPDHVPQFAAWVTGDLFATIPDDRIPHYLGKRVKARFAFPAVDLTSLLAIPLFADAIAQRDPFQGGNRAERPMFLAYASGDPQSDDLRWDLHPPVALDGSASPVIQAIRQLIEILTLPGGGADGWRIPEGIEWVKLPADFWRADLQEGIPSWFWPTGVNLDSLSAEVQGLIPDEVLKGQSQLVVDRYWLPGFRYSLDQLQPESLTQQTLDQRLGLEAVNPGVGRITVYLPDDVPRGATVAPGAAIDTSTLATGGELPPGELPPGELAPGELPPGELAPGELAPGELAPGELPPGELPPGELPPYVPESYASQAIPELAPGELPPGYAAGAPGAPEFVSADDQAVEFFPDEEGAGEEWEEVELEDEGAGEEWEEVELEDEGAGQEWEEVEDEGAGEVVEVPAGELLTIEIAPGVYRRAWRSVSGAGR